MAITVKHVSTTYHGEGDMANGATPFDLTIAAPPNLAAGDLWIVFSFSDVYGGVGNMSVPSGWTRIIHKINSNGYPILDVLYKVATGSEPNVVLQYAAGIVQHQAYCMTLTGYDSITPFSIYADYEPGDNSVVNMPAINVADDNSLLIVGAVTLVDDSPMTFSLSSGWTTTSYWDTASTWPKSISGYKFVNTSNVSNGSVTYIRGTARNVMAQLVVKPTSGGGQSLTHNINESLNFTDQLTTNKYTSQQKAVSEVTGITEQLSFNLTSLILSGTRAKIFSPAEGPYNEAQFTRRRRTTSTVVRKARKFRLFN
jgi:hypothetical protein